MKIETNKIIYTNDVFSAIQRLTSKDQMIITPMTSIGEILNLKKTNIIYRQLQESNLINKIFNLEIIKQVCQHINNQYLTEILSWNLAEEKVIKLIFDVIANTPITPILLNKILHHYDQVATKVTTFIISGFNINDLIQQELNMINVIWVTSKLPPCLRWSNLRMLIIDLEHDFLEILDPEKFLNWLELKTKSVLTIKDLDHFLSNKWSFNSFLIERALKNLL